MLARSNGLTPNLLMMSPSPLSRSDTPCDPKMKAKAFGISRLQHSPRPKLQTEGTRTGTKSRLLPPASHPPSFKACRAPRPGPQSWPP